MRSSQRLATASRSEAFAEMAIDAAVAHIERAGNVDHGGLGKPVAPEHVLGDFEDPLRRQDNGFIHASTMFPFGAQLPGSRAASEAPLPVVQKSLCLNEAVCSLRRDLARHQQIEPMPNHAGEIEDFGRHFLSLHSSAVPVLRSALRSELVSDVGLSGFIADAQSERPRRIYTSR